MSDEWAIVDDALRQRGSKYDELIRALDDGKTVFLPNVISHDKAPLSVLRYRLWLTKRTKLRVRRETVDGVEGSVIWSEAAS